MSNVVVPANLRTPALESFRLISVTAVNNLTPQAGKKRMPLAVALQSTVEVGFRAQENGSEPRPVVTVGLKAAGRPKGEDAAEGSVLSADAKYEAVFKVLDVAGQLPTYLDALNPQLARELVLQAYSPIAAHFQEFLSRMGVGPGAIPLGFVDALENKQAVVEPVAKPVAKGGSATAPRAKKKTGVSRKVARSKSIA